MAKLYQVKGLKKLPVAELSSFGNFNLLATGEIDFQSYLLSCSSLLTPFAIDYKERSIVFVESPVHASQLLSAPFLYQAQREFAERVLVVPFDEVLALHLQSAPQLENEKNLVFLHSTGRCGSTLLCNLLEDTGQVLAISEPDFYTQWVMLDQQYGSTLDQRIPLVVEKLTRILLAGLEHSTEQKVLVIKLRGMCIHIADLLQQSHPYAKNIFLYRNAFDTSNSFLGMLLKRRFVYAAKRLFLDKLPVFWFSHIPILKNKLGVFAPLLLDARYNRHGIRGSAGILALSWLSKMDRALRLIEERSTFFVCSIRYEDLLTDYAQLMQSLLPLLGGHSLKPSVFQTMERSMGSNSQRGSGVESDGIYRLDDEDVGMIGRVLIRHNVINESDFVLPGTLSITGDGGGNKALAAGT